MRIIKNNRDSRTHQLHRLLRCTPIHMALFGLLLFIAPTMLWAVPTVTVNVTNGTCKADGIITVEVKNTTGEVRYALIEPSTVTTTTQISNVFPGLPAGSYTVAVYDASTGSDPAKVTVALTSSYIDMTMYPPSSGTDYYDYCSDHNGILSGYVSYGTPPYTVKLIGPVTKTMVLQEEDYGSYTFESLPTGLYDVEIKDACNETRATVSKVSVESNTLSLQGVQLQTLEYNNALVQSSYDGFSIYNCNQLSLRIYNYMMDYSLDDVIKIKDQLNNVYPLTTYSALNIRLEYPAGSGQYSEWSNLSNYIDLLYFTSPSNYDPANNQYRLQLLSPCDGRVISSPVYTLPPSNLTFSARSDGFIYQNMCDSPNEVSIWFNTSTPEGSIPLFCPPYTITAVPRGGGATVTSTWNDTYTYNYSRGYATGKTYDITITNGTQTGNVVVTTPTPTATHLVSTSASYSDNLGKSKCDFNTITISGSIRTPSGSDTWFYGRGDDPWEYKIKGAVTYSILSGPATRSPITLEKGEGALWDDLPYGSYVVRANYCGRYNDITVNAVKKVYGLYVSPLTYENTTVCGSYDLSFNAWYYDAAGSRISSSIEWFSYKKNASSTGKTSISSILTNGFNNGAPIKIQNVQPGYYAIDFYVGGSYMCYSETETITLPVYKSPMVNVALSGGISCAAGVASLTVTATGTREPFSYRIKNAGTDDDSYSAWQQSNVFANKLPGNYEVQVRDQCNGGTTQLLRVYNGTDQFVGVVGELSIGSGQVCQGKPVEVTVLSIGPVKSYQWFKDGVALTGVITTPDGAVYRIASVQPSDVGSYKVRIDNGSCQLESAVSILEVLPPAPKPTISGASIVCPGGTALLTAETVSSLPAYQWYKDGTPIEGVNTATYTVSEAANYTVVVTPSGSCPSELSDVHTVSIQTLPQPGISASTNTPCAGESLQLTSTTVAGVSYEWYKKTSVSGPYVLEAITMTNTYATPLMSSTQSYFYRLVLRSAETCTSAPSADFIVTPTSGTNAPSIAATGNPILCAGQSVQLTATSTGGTPAYQWYKDGMPISGAIGADYTASEAGNYTARITNIAGCGSDFSNTVTVSAPPQAATPTITGETFVMCETMTLTAHSAENPPVFQWYKDGVALSGEVAATYTVVGAGNYTVTVTVLGGCPSNHSIPHHVEHLEGKSYSDAPFSYGVASHALGQCLFLGGLDELKIQEPPQSSTAANTAQNDDGINGGVIPVLGNYTDLTHAKFSLGADGHLRVNVQATNLGQLSATLLAWIDFDQNGKFDATEASDLVTIPSSTNDQEYTLVWLNAAANVRKGITYLRVRTTNETMTVSDAVTPYGNGEVEDYKLNLYPYGISKQALVKGKLSGDHASIGDTIVYTITLNNQLPLAVEFNVVDPIPENSEYVAGSANPTGTLTNVTITTTTLQAIQWNPLQVTANTEMVVTFEVAVKDYPKDPHQIVNVAYAIRGTDTINSVGEACELASVVVDALMAGNDCAITFVDETLSSIDIRINDTDPERNYIVETKIIPNLNQQGTASINSDGTMKYVPKENFVGLDSVQYQIKVPGDSVRAWVRIAVMEQTQTSFLACAERPFQLGVNPIDKVSYSWYKEDGSVIVANGSRIDVMMGNHDTTYYVAATIGDCVTPRLPIGVQIMQSVRHTDIRVQLCTLPDRPLNLSSYIDTLYFVSVNWTRLGPGSAATLPIGQQGEVHTGGFSYGTYKYGYEVTNTCSTDRGVLYLSISSRPVGGSSVDTLVVCKDFAERINLKQLFGVEAQGTWTYDNLLKKHIVTATSQPYAGAMFLNGSAAHRDPDLDGFTTTYRTDTDARQFELTYTADPASCMGNKEIKIVVIITSVLF